MHKKIRILSVTLLGCLAMSCAKSPSSAGKDASASAKSTTSTDTQQATKGGGSSSGGNNSLSGLEALLGGLTGKKGAGGFAEGGMGADGGSSAPTDPNAVQWASEFGAPFLSFQLYDLQKNFLNEANIIAGKDSATVSDAYDCPGDSLLMGFRSVYDEALGDRQMQPYCHFLNDGLNRPMKKQNCTTVSAFPAASTGPIFTCSEGRFLAGFRSTWNATAHDRAYEFTCCELANQDGTKMNFLTTLNQVTNLPNPICETYPGSPIAQVNHLHEVMDFQCSGQVIDPQTGQGLLAPTTLQTVIANYSAYKTGEGVIQNDRVWSMQCCAIGVNAPAGSSATQMK